MTFEAFGGTTLCMGTVRSFRVRCRNPGTTLHFFCGIVYDLSLKDVNNNELEQHVVW